jgi:ribonuclease HI
MITIYTDGAARNNPGKAGFGAIIIDNEKGHVVELGGHSPHATNNQMELTGALKALEYVGSIKNYTGQKIALYTDSSYVINGMKSWIFNWQKNSWKTSQKKDVENSLLWKQLLLVSKDKDIEWLYVRGHSGVPLNERADQIATSFADRVKIELFNGETKKYLYDTSVPENVKPKNSESKSKSPKNGYYVVFKLGKLSRYETWTECENAVKGVKGVRFKKVTNKDQEKQFLDSIQ